MKFFAPLSLLSTIAVCAFAAPNAPQCDNQSFCNTLGQVPGNVNAITNIINGINERTINTQCELLELKVITLLDNIDLCRENVCPNTPLNLATQLPKALADLGRTTAELGLGITGINNCKPILDKFPECKKLIARICCQIRNKFLPFVGKLTSTDTCLGAGGVSLVTKAVAKLLPSIDDTIKGLGATCPAPFN